MKTKIGILDYGVGNIRSLKNAIKRFNLNYVISNNEIDLIDCTHYILPGVGAFPYTIKQFKLFKLDKFLNHITNSNKPCLGICVGHQMMFLGSEEFQWTDGFKIFDGKVTNLCKMNKNIDKVIKYPNVNYLKINCMFDKNNKNERFKFIDQFHNEKFYFIHSFAAQKASASCLAFSSYEDIDFCSIANEKNFIGVQFHPEKSNEIGLLFIREFINSY